MRAKWFAILGSLMLLSTAAAALWWYRTHRSAPRTQDMPASTLASDISLPGRIQAKNVILVAAPIQGKVEAFHVEVGDEVYEGQLIAQIRNETIEGHLEGAQADAGNAQTRVNNLESALIAARLEASRARADASRSRSEADRTQKLFERQRMLLAEGATPRRTFDKAEKDSASAQIEAESLDTIASQAESRAEQIAKDLDTAKKALDQKNADLEDVQADIAAGEVHAPANGIISGRRGEAGDEVNRTMNDLFQIATDLSTMQVVVEFPPPALVRIKPGQPALVQVAELPGEGLQGVVRSKEAGKVVVEFANPSPLVRPGLTAQVKIKLSAIP